MTGPHSSVQTATLVLPEIWLQGYNQPDIPARALRLDSAPMQRLSRAARTSATTLVVGYAERDGSSVYNSAACFGPDGSVLANHRKLQLYGPREHGIYTPGDTFTTFSLGAQTAAILICYDVEFASHIKTLADRGVTLILVPTANMSPFTHVARHTVPAMSANHGVTIVYANYCGREGKLDYVGLSLITGPHGEIVAQAGDTPTLLVAEIPHRDPARLSTQAADLRLIE
ncbi:MAG: nitrilase [Rhodobacterales bacterium]|nr:nitrilase [Rhodobacterales bacterium]